jgi:KipI family sensor histidine kinase inhibitor
MIRIGAPRNDGFAVAPMADHGLLCTFGDEIDAELSTRIAMLTDVLTAEGIAGVEDYVPSYTTLVIILEPHKASVPAIVDRVSHHWQRIRRKRIERGTSREVVIPVHYGDDAGPDLQEVCRVTGLPPAEVIARHSGARYQVGAIGFSPGFAFLIGLPSELAVPRRSTPRTAVPAGSVGIGGPQTGIYSLETPGGWSLIGRTPLVMFDPERDPPSLLRAGDSVRFEPVRDLAHVRLPQRGSRSFVPQDRPDRPLQDNHAAIEVLAAGLQTSVQDLGRPGYGRLGIAPGGATDRGALIWGNRLLGNPDGAAGIEIALAGPRLGFLKPGRIASTGADLGACLNGMRMVAGSVRVAPVTNCPSITAETPERAPTCACGAVSMSRSSWAAAPPTSLPDSAAFRDAHCELATGCGQVCRSTITGTFPVGNGRTQGPPLGKSVFVTAMFFAWCVVRTHHGSTMRPTKRCSRGSLRFPRNRIDSVSAWRGRRFFRLAAPTSFPKEW